MKRVESHLSRTRRSEEAVALGTTPIMQDSEDVRAKYHRAYDRYKRTHRGVEEFYQEASAMFERANGDRKKSDRAWDRISNECPDEMNTQFLQIKCAPGYEQYRAICAAFGQ